MITFTVPINDYFAEITTFTVDRNPSRSYEVRMLKEEVAYAVLEQSRSDGENPVVITSFDFKIANLTMAVAKALDLYFESLKGSEAITVTFPSGDKKFQIITWNVDVGSSKFATIVAKGEEVFL